MKRYRYIYIYKLAIVFVLSFLVFSNTLVYQNTKAASSTKYIFDIVDCGAGTGTTRYCAKDGQGNEESLIVITKTSAGGSNSLLEIKDNTNINGITVLNISVYTKTMSIHPSGSNTRVPEIHFLATSQTGYFNATATGNIKIANNATGLEKFGLTIKGSLENSTTLNTVTAEQITSSTASKFFINNGEIIHGISAFFYDEFVNNGTITDDFRIVETKKIINTSNGVFGNIEIISKQGTTLEFINEGTVQEISATRWINNSTGALIPDGNFKIVNEASGIITSINSTTTNTMEIINKGSITDSITSVNNPNFSYESQGGTCGSITIGSTTYPPGTSTVGTPPSGTSSSGGSSSTGGTTSSGGSSTTTIDKKKESDKIIKDFDKFMKAKPSKTKIEKTTATYLSKIYKLWPNNTNSTTYIKKIITTGIKYLKGLSKNDRLSKQKAFLLKAAKSVKLDKAVPSKVKGKTLTKAQKTKWKNDRIKSVKKTVAKYGVSKLKSSDKSTVKNYLKSKLKLNF